MKIVARVGGASQGGIERGLQFESSTPEVARATRATAGSAAVSPRQATCLQAIREFRATHMVSPSRSELRGVLQLGKHSSVEKHLDGLARRKWIMVMPGVERGIVPLREGVPLYEVHALESAQAGLKDQGRRPAEPTWIDCPALWEGMCEIPDLCLRMPTDDTEGRSVILALARRRDAGGNANVPDGADVVARIGKEIVLATARVLDENTVELRWGSAEGKTPTRRLTEESDAAEIVGTVIGRLLPGPG